MTGIEQPKVQYETGESLLLGQRAYPFGLRRFHLGKGTVAKEGCQLGTRKWGGLRKATVCC